MGPVYSKLSRETQEWKIELDIGCMKNIKRDMSIDIVYENSDLIVVNKPAGLLSHSDSTGAENLLQRLQTQKKASLHVLNRLDKEASGLVLLVHNTKIAEYQSLWQKPESRKIYTAITHGLCQKNEMIWSWPLSDKAEGRKNPQGLSAQRMTCETRVKVLKSNQYFSWIEAQLVTGRQHQIRKHAAVNRTALVGDTRYGDPKKTTLVNRIYGFQRLALHCSRIDLGPGLQWESPAPSEFGVLFK